MSELSVFFFNFLNTTDLQTIKDINLFFFFNVLCLIEGLSYTFILCYYATETTTSLSDIADTIYESVWFLQPITIQKTLILMMARSQRPVVYMGFKIIECTTASFMRVYLL